MVDVVYIPSIAVPDKINKQQSRYAVFWFYDISHLNSIYKSCERLVNDNQLQYSLSIIETTTHECIILSLGSVRNNYYSIRSYISTCWYQTERKRVKTTTCQRNFETHLMRKNITYNIHIIAISLFVVVLFLMGKIRGIYLFLKCLLLIILVAIGFYFDESFAHLCVCGLFPLSVASVIHAASPPTLLHLFGSTTDVRGGGRSNSTKWYLCHTPQVNFRDKINCHVAKN